MKICITPKCNSQKKFYIWSLSIENFITSFSVNNHGVGNPEKEKESERKYPLVVELLKSKVSTLEKHWLRRMLLSISC